MQQDLQNLHAARRRLARACLQGQGQFFRRPVGKICLAPEPHAVNGRPKCDPVSVFAPVIAEEIPMQPSVPNPDPKFHVARIRKEFLDLVEHLRDDVKQVEEPKAQALFETSAEVLGGLAKAFDDYERNVEPGMRRR